MNGTNNASPFFGGGGQRKETQAEDSSTDFMNQIDKKAQKTVPAPYSHKVSYCSKQAVIGKLQKNKRSHSENRTLDSDMQKCTLTNNGNEAAKTGRKQQNQENMGISKVSEALQTLEKSLKEVGGGKHIFEKAEGYIKNKLKYFFYC